MTRNFILFIHLLHSCVSAVSPSGLKFSFPFSLRLFFLPAKCAYIFPECPPMHPQSCFLAHFWVVHTGNCASNLLLSLYLLLGVADLQTCTSRIVFSCPKPCFLFCHSFHLVLSSVRFTASFALFLFSIQPTSPHFSSLLIFFSSPSLPFHSFCSILFPVLHTRQIPASSSSKALLCPRLTSHKNNHVVVICQIKLEQCFLVLPGILTQKESAKIYGEAYLPHRTLTRWPYND